jgi:hypothetical protein
VARAIGDVLERWAKGCPVREARAQLARLLALLEAVEGRGLTRGAAYATVYSSVASEVS